MQPGVQPDEGDPGWRLVDELPFEPSRGYHAALGPPGDGQVLSVKGAPEIVLPLCTALAARRLDRSRSTRPPGPRSTPRSTGSPCRATGCSPWPSAPRHAGRPRRGPRRRPAFLGLLAFADPVRATAAQAVTGLHAAACGIVMATGDHPSTAEAIAAELGMLADGAVLTGAEVDTMDDDELVDLLPKISVFARVTPTHKVRIVRRSQQAGHTVAMTGDGANDAPAIRLADVGVALGDRGTDAAREAADLVVTDDRHRDRSSHAIVEGAGDVVIRPRRRLRPARRQPRRDRVHPRHRPALARRIAAQRPPAAAREPAHRHAAVAGARGTATRTPRPRDAPPRRSRHVARRRPDPGHHRPRRHDRRRPPPGPGWSPDQPAPPRHASTVALATLVGTQLGQTIAGRLPQPAGRGREPSPRPPPSAAIIQTPGLSHFFGCRPLGPLGWSTATTASAIGTGASLAASALAARHLQPGHRS